MAAHSPRPQDAAVAVGDHAAHLLTRHRATLREVEQGTARLEDRLLGRTLGDTERDRDLRVREPAQLAHDQRPTLAVAELAKVADQLRQPLALEGALRGRGSRSLAALAQLRG